ncbi:hypothetical protein GCM10007886_13380 [Methylobacterium gregans]|uniref:OmpA/MotB domain protein n=1 Tax=Methylobacterium gregans TaxID=374424 RepID=A0AA37HPP4_9HYPH|nr:hypothetical protein [Methylobacterium gregans]MDQ0520897.1 outer membrane protein OmpA-like peptidoglycan-associated protein [Methylobacterium gregans]GJD79355.1 hypothetical protein NBEOAGPD_2580 [Methylobacterium gregans]GLS53155.1 hypothetical protein GCM10007886_13380 [Methylobacterium gregans]
MPLPDRQTRLRRVGWLAGLPLLALAWGGATLLAAPRIGARIEAEARDVARLTEDREGEPWLRVAARGRDLVAKGEAPGEAERATVLTRLAALPSPRRIVSEIGLVETAAPFVWSAERTGAGIALSGNRPAEIGRRALEETLVAALPSGSRLTDEARAARGAPPDFPAAAAYAAAKLSRLARGARVSLTDTVISASGEAVDVAAYDALRGGFGEPPRGYSIGRIDILPPSVSDFRFAVERLPGGGLVLTGHTISENARAEIRKAATEAAAGAFVDDRTRTARGLPPGIEPGALAGAMLALSDLLQSGRVTFENGRVSVAGDALDAQAVGEAETLMRVRLPAGVAAGSVALAVRPLSPYRVSLRREADSVVVTGHLPGPEARERLLAALRPRFFRERVLDRTRLADGAPPNLSSALEAAVPALANLAEGEIAVADANLVLTGESLYRESAERVTESLPRALPAGWTARVAVQPRGTAPRREPESCRTSLDAAWSERLRFEPGSTALTAAMYPILDAAASLAKACPTLRLAVTGHADPPGAKPQKPAEPAPETKPAEAAEKDATSKAVKGTAKGGPKGAAKTPAKPPPKPEPPPEPSGEDLARLRAQVVVEYLLQAGAAAGQVAVADGPAGERRSVALASGP